MKHGNDIKKKLAFFAKVIYIAALIGINGYFLLWIAPEMRRKNLAKRTELRERIEILKPNAEMGDADAQYGLAIIFAYNGDGAVTDYKEAFAWAEKAAQSDHMQAQLLLGQLCEDSCSESGLRGVKCKWNEMFKWYQKAAEQGEPEAQFLLAKNLYSVYHLGNNKQEAYKWYLRSAKQGNPPASLFVGADMYYVGEGVEKDLIKAYMWVRLAAKGIDKWTVEKTLGKIAKDMNPDEIAKAEDLAKHWIPQKE
jgi:uncharacterized protein